MSLRNLTLVATLGAALTTGALAWQTPSSSHAQGGAALPTLPMLPSLGLGASDDISDVAERVVDSVVNVSSSRAAQVGPASFDPFFNDPNSPWGGAPEGRKAQSLGSGVIVNDSGRILTNAHVVNGADEITVTLHDGRDYDAALVGIDPRSDLAVLQLQGKVSGLRPLRFADSSKARLGQVVLAVGNPFGVGQAVTMGIVSATGRGAVGIVDYEDFIQTDAAINPGNSGGALVDLDGNLLGINTAILSRSGGYQGIGFAIPTHMAKPIMDMLVKDGKVVRGFLGVGIDTVTQRIAKQENLSASWGVYIGSVEPRGPAAKAGLEVGDIVQRIDGKEVREASDLRNTIAMKGVGGKAQLSVVRGGQPVSIDVTLTAVPEAKPRTSRRVRRIP